MKRILLCSFIFDLGNSENYIYSPTVNLYWSFENTKKPIELSVKYAWQDFKVSYTCKLIEKIDDVFSFIKLAKNEISERVLNHSLLFKIDMSSEFYISPHGKVVVLAKDEIEVKRYMETVHGNRK